MLSIITLMQAGLPLASDRSIAPGISSALYIVEVVKVAAEYMVRGVRLGDGVE
jgi:hypothetical protein